MGKKVQHSSRVRVGVFLPIVEGSLCGFFYFCYSEESILSVFSLHQTQTHFCRSCSALIPWQQAPQAITQAVKVYP